VAKVLTVLGTRPEAIKLAPVIRRLAESRTLASAVCVTGQHRQMLDQVLGVFGIRPDHDLNVMRENQDLFSLTAALVSQMRAVLERSRPDLVLVQGDTTTTFAAALAAFYARAPVGHVEAGLRTYDKSAPFPEEVNRRLTATLAELHFAPTHRAAENLYKEGVSPEKVFVTGNTVVDALLGMANHAHASDALRRLQEEYGVPAPPRRLVLITGHRRESFGQGFRNICTAVRRLAAACPDCDFVYPVHLNPHVQTPVQAILNRGRLPNVHLLEPLEYVPFVTLMRHAYLVVTDSGGVQEEAVAFGKPILILRDATERPEGVQVGAARLVGSDEDVIFAEVRRLLADRAEYAGMTNKPNPYGDGRAAERIVSILESALAGNIGASNHEFPISSCELPEAHASRPRSAGVNP
jgi:UDP-N-acetylglucosamine 2-epimerase (non-hydrolysing)